MLAYFTIQNFKSILDMKIDFTYAEKKAPNGYREMEMLPFLHDNGKQRVVPCLALYGANASGKSNVIQAFSIFKSIITKGLKPQFFNPNRLNTKHETTSFELGFYLEESLYSYYMEFDEKQIRAERLMAGQEILYEIETHKQTFMKIESEVYTIKKLQEVYAVECLDEKRYQTKPFLTVLGQGFAGLSKSVTSAFLYITKRIDVYPTDRPKFSICLDKLAGSENQEDLKEAFQKIVTTLRKFDIDIARMEHDREQFSEESIPSFSGKPYTIKKLHPLAGYVDTIRSYHLDVHGEEVGFDFSEESEGTQRLSCLIGMLLYALDRGTVVIIDELALSLHPAITTQLVRLFKNRRYNTLNAQLIFTTHNTEILDEDLLRISEIGIINKTLKSGSTIKRVSDFKGVRNVTNFRKQYLRGTFTGIPFPYI